MGTSLRRRAFACKRPRMTTIEIPTTEKMNGSSRMTPLTDSPWWIVRPSLAAALAGSLAITSSAFHIAGLTPALTLKPRALSGLMQLLSATPTLAGIGLLACLAMMLRGPRRSSKILCALLAAAALTGAWLNAARESRGTGVIELWVASALAYSPPALAGQ